MVGAIHKQKADGSQQWIFPGRVMTKVNKCPGCGRIVEMPCKACADEAVMSSPKLTPEDFKGVDVQAVLRRCSTYTGPKKKRKKRNADKR